MIIGIAGMVGTGKTTLSRALAARFALQLALESVDEDNPWLAKFYGEQDGMRRYSLPLQLHFLASRFASLRRMRGLGGSWVLDRTWYEDAEIFARGQFEQDLMTRDEWDLYRRLYMELISSPAAHPPRLLVYLHGPLEVVLARIAERGRDKERDTPPEYWAEMHERYVRWIATFRRCAVLTLDIREYDLLHDAEATEDIAARVRLQLEGELPQTELWPPRLRHAV